MRCSGTVRVRLTDGPGAMTYILADAILSSYQRRVVPPCNHILSDNLCHARPVHEHGYSFVHVVTVDVSFWNCVRANFCPALP